MSVAGHLQLHCDDGARRARVLAETALDGIEYLEVSAESWLEQRFLHVHFLREALGDPPPAGLAGNPGAFRITGGVRERGLRVLGVVAQAGHLVVEVDRAGDFSAYVLEIPDHPGLDPAFRAVEFSFKAGCYSPFDCGPRDLCPPQEGPEPEIDYLARDYASFRRALLDLVPTLVPEWTDRHEADLGMTLVELMAYAGDHLSYQLDAVSSELHLESARQRISVRRHARLLDYAMHDGASARTFVHFRVGAPGAVPAGLPVLSRVEVPLDAEMPPHPPVLDGDLAAVATAAAAAVFETMTERPLGTPVDPLLNEIALHAWGDLECCLPTGATSVDLLGDLGAVLAAGDFLLFEEVRGPVTGLAADADPAHRQVVRLTAVEAAQDPLPLAEGGAAPVALTRVTWHEADALAFPLCLSARTADGAGIAGVSVARGNLVLADHGLTVVEAGHLGPAAAPHPGRRLAHRIQLRSGPLSFRAVPARALGAAAGEPPPVAALQVTDPATAEAQVVLEVAGSAAPWRAARHLLDDGPFDERFAVETDDAGRALLRFGDGELGRVPPTGAALVATYRVGVGTAGNAGADSLTHVLEHPALPPVLAVRNPLAAWGGIEPEPVERVQQLAPPAMHAVQFRAVTEEDYARAAEKHPEVARAVATFRWTGSWHTVFVTVDRCGGREVTPEFEAEVRDLLEASRLAGYDLEVDGPVLVPLDIEIDVCVAAGHFRAHVAEALEEALSSRDLARGRRGFFHPDGLTFGDTLYLSRLYAAVEAVPGVDSAELRRFERWGRGDAGELAAGRMSFGRLEIARLDNDPSYPEHGVLRINVVGGK
ncbi:MAG TPA: baseplate J/gp47 family protein [Thermoanaerobaculia bacterium]|nr:baseplate J/gp47 family protein [Thermoanaerobaculia bacterium]